MQKRHMASNIAALKLSTEALWRRNAQLSFVALSTCPQFRALVSDPKNSALCRHQNNNPPRLHCDWRGELFVTLQGHLSALRPRPKSCFEIDARCTRRKRTPYAAPALMISIRRQELMSDQDQLIGLAVAITRHPRLALNEHYRRPKIDFGERGGAVWPLATNARKHLTALAARKCSRSRRKCHQGCARRSRKQDEKRRTVQYEEGRSIRMRAGAS